MCVNALIGRYAVFPAVLAARPGRGRQDAAAVVCARYSLGLTFHETVAAIAEATGREIRGRRRLVRLSGQPCLSPPAGHC